MENRRTPLQNPSKPFKQRSNFQKPDERTGVYRKFQPRDTKFQPRDNKLGSQTGRFQDKEERFGNRNGTADSQNNRFQIRKNFSQPRDKKISKSWEKEKRTPIISDMQITDGKHYGKYLQSSTSPQVRPTAQRIREVMFRILLRRVRAGRFLDLCAGIGTVGIEALSRGALIGTFVERSARMCSFIKKNLQTLNIKEGHGEVFETEVVPFLKQMEKRRRFWDVVFYNPPFDVNYDEVLNYFSRGVALKPKGVLVIEHHSEMFFPEKIGAIRRWRVVVQGETALSFYEKINLS